MLYLLKDELRNAFSLSVTTEGYEDWISASLKRLISVSKSFSVAFSFAGYTSGAPFPHAVAEAIIVRRMSAEKSPAHTVEILRIELKWARSALLVLLVTELAFDARCWAMSV